MPGQRVVLAASGAPATVVDFPSEDRVRVKFPSPFTPEQTIVVERYEVRTRASMLYHCRAVMAVIAADNGDTELADASDQMAALVIRAANRCDAADAVRGLS